MSRLDKVNELMKREIGTMLLEDVRDPRLEFVTITRVSVSPDLHNAYVNFSVLGDAKKILAAEDALSRARGFIRKLVGQRVRLRYTPDIEFIFDPSVTDSDRIERIIDEIHKTEESKP